MLAVDAGPTGRPHRQQACWSTLGVPWAWARAWAWALVSVGLLAALPPPQGHPYQAAMLSHLGCLAATSAWEMATWRLDQGMQLPLRASRSRCCQMPRAAAMQLPCSCHAKRWVSAGVALIHLAARALPATCLLHLVTLVAGCVWALASQLHLFCDVGGDKTLQLSPGTAPATQSK